MNPLDVPNNHISQAEENRITYDFNLTVLTNEDMVKFCIGDISTSWLSLEDNFISRIQFDNLNPYFLEKHLIKEIEIKNRLDKGIDFLNNQNYSKSIECFDEVLYYDPNHGEALFFKSKAVFGQGHFVKSLRNYKKAIRADASLKDVEYHKLLLKKSSEERDNFPKIKRNIYAGDEYFAKGEYMKALECYDKALLNPTNFKNKILSKLLNKKATTLIRLGRTDEAMDIFRKSVSVKKTDYACYYLGICDDSFNPYIEKAVNITKRQLLLKASRLNDFGRFDLALDCLNQYFDNHFAIDEDYKSALKLKFDVLKSLDMDTREVELILSDLQLN